ncbi:hypothetical protein [Catenuloplanes indicus]|uniref:Uncharacterized protein n=1 Tax=Catenuloplanes indicus TaxID=137267 RepID=A0AAE3VT45_9ACTN|nr:hypothetical protein [Catenuloplanes indicus]MDQ0363413.1 hypothetical protein [Catenuloplanes indicus]
MDVRSRIQPVVATHLAGDTVDADTLAQQIGDALEAGGIYTGDEIADYLTDIPDWDQLGADRLAEQLAEAIEADRDEEG